MTKAAQLRQASSADIPVLLEAAERIFAQAGCTNVSLQRSRANGTARAFYRSRGYAERPGFELLDKMLRKG